MAGPPLLQPLFLALQGTKEKDALTVLPARCLQNELGAHHHSHSTLSDVIRQEGGMPNNRAEIAEKVMWFARPIMKIPNPRIQIRTSQEAPILCITQSTLQYPQQIRLWLAIENEANRTFLLQALKHQDVDCEGLRKVILALNLCSVLAGQNIDTGRKEFRPTV